MKTIDTSGPAFPTHEQRFPDGVLSRESEYGMTLRDYFAAKAMQAEVSTWGATNPSERAKDAYSIADAMLEARK